MEFIDMMRLEPHGPDTFVGVGPRYPWGGLYGGQIVAQGLRAAAHSVDPRYHVHSLHAYFIRRGDHDAPVRYEVDRIRDGRSFVTRRVVARQSAGAILNMSASFQLPEDVEEVQTVRPFVDLDPTALTGHSWSDAFERRDVRYRDEVQPARVAWLRVKGPLPNDPLLHACALAYTSDDLPTEAVIARHPAHRADKSTPFWNASLDHAIWFHAPIQADAFNLHQFTCQSLRGARGLTSGHVFDGQGRHLATVTQEVLLRIKKG